MMKTFIRAYTDGHKRIPSIYSDCLLSVLYDSLRFMTWSWVLCEAPKYEAMHRVDGEEANFLGWQVREFFMIPREERAEFYSRVPN